jgi:coenzyme Q-binding protein COQ10
MMRNSLSVALRDAVSCSKHVHLRTTYHLQVQRHFITLPGAEIQSLQAAKVLPYASKDLYSIIADVEAYSTFLPYCLESRVLPHAASPAKAGSLGNAIVEMRVGWGAFDETFKSAVSFVPGRIVEAIAGAARSEIPSDIKGERIQGGPDSDIFSHLLTTWTVKAFPFKPPPGGDEHPSQALTKHEAKEMTEVDLKIEFAMKNPLYGTLSKAVAPKVAGIMMSAFVQRAEELLGKEVHMNEGAAAGIEGVVGGQGDKAHERQ